MSPGHYRRKVRRLFGPLIITFATLLSAGCTVATGGLAGVGIDRDGNLVGYIHVCHDHIDGATLYYDNGSTSSAASTADAGSWKASTPITATATWSLTQPGHGWTVLMPLQNLTKKREYTLYGWTNDNSWSAGSVTFTTTDVARLRPGQILHFSGRSGDAPVGDVNEVSSLADFAVRACQFADS